MKEYNNHGSIKFIGTGAADLFTKELELSLKGVLEKNMITDESDPMVGFTSASIDGRPWTGTMWTRDAGVFMRELVHWGYIGYACRLAENLIKLVEKSSEGFYTFPMYFELGKPASGDELDGTSAIIISMALLWERLEDGNRTKEKIRSFLISEESPLEYIVTRLSQYPLIPGSGEFGGGCGIEGEFYNVVQNGLVRLALTATERIARTSGESSKADIYGRCAKQISENMLNYLRNEDGSWIWCVDTVTTKPDPEVINSLINKGFGGINGVFSMLSDVFGFEPLGMDWKGNAACIKTFQKLFEFPLREAMFEKYGVWTQFDEFCNGYFSSPSYGHSYATQAMLLSDRMDMADKALKFLAEVTYKPFERNVLDRDSEYYFYERFYLPELAGVKVKINDMGFNVYDGEKFDQGCGALNLVNVAEPMKVARLITGIDDSDPDELKIIPRIPASWGGYEVNNWPVLTKEGLKYIDVRCSYKDGGFGLSFKVCNGGKVPCVSVRMPLDGGYVWKKYYDSGEFNI